MAITHNWSIRHLNQLNDGTGTVCEIFYHIESRDGDISIDDGGVVRLNTENIENFISYESLTEEVVLNWVKDSLGEQVNNIESNNASWIDSVKNPPAPRTITAPLPWSN